MNKNINPIIITGATGVGKTKLSIEIAKQLSGEIISADSMQIYKNMNVGTAKITSEEMDSIKHHMIDVVEPYESFSVAQYQKMALLYIKDIISRGKTPIIVGGTGLYLDSLIFDLDFNQTSANAVRRNELENILLEKGPIEIIRIYKSLINDENKDGDIVDINNMRRVIRTIEILENNKDKKDFKHDIKEREDLHFKMFILQRDRDELYNLINKRVDIMIDNGLVNEVKDLVQKGLNNENQSMKAIGYRQIYQHLLGEISLNDAIELIKRDSRRYAKRQITWFKKYAFADTMNITNTKFDKILFDTMKEIDF